MNPSTRWRKLARFDSVVSAHSQGGYVKTAIKMLVLGGSVPTVILPQYLATSAPVLFDDFETLTGWTFDDDAHELNTTQFKTGAASIRETTHVGTYGSLTKTTNWNLSTAQAFRIWFYAEDRTKLASFWIYLAQAAFTKWQFLSQSVDILHNRWNGCQILASDAIANGGANWTDAFDRFRPRLNAAASQNGIGSFDTFQVLAAKPTPAVMITFDDTPDTIYTNAYPYMRARRIPATAYMVTDLIDSAGYMSAAQLQALDAAGWDVGSHGKTHTSLAAPLTQEQIETELTTAQAALDALGLTRASRHVAYPNGAFDDTTLLAMAAAGMLTGRSTNAQRQPICPPSHNHYIECQNIANTTTLATAKGYIDTAIAKGTVCSLLFHSIVETPSIATEWSIANFQALMDYILQVRIQPITMSQFYALQSGNVLVQRPAW